MKLKRFLLILVLGLSSHAGITIRAQEQPQKGATEYNEEKACVLVAGAVKKPRSLPLEKRLRLSELIEQAGGLTKGAGGTVQIVHSGMFRCPPGQTVRPAGSVPVTLEVLYLDQLTRGGTYDPLIQPGDVVIVAEAAVVYVVGNVLNPQGMYMRESLTLTQAIALAGGTLKNSRTNKIRVYRQNRGSDSTTQIIVDLDKIKKGHFADLFLLPYDIVEVPVKGNYGGLRNDRSHIMDFSGAQPPSVPAIIIK